MQFFNTTIFRPILLQISQVIKLALCSSLFLFGDLLSEPVGSEPAESITKRIGVLRVIQPGIFDYQSNDFLVRMRAWGVIFPLRGQPGYEEAFSFSEKFLLDRNITFEVKSEFDQQNLKVVDILVGLDKENFSRVSIEYGIGWHNELETNKAAPLVISQLKAKRKQLGIWKGGAEYQSAGNVNNLPAPLLRSMIGQNPFTSSINYWVTTFGKIHRPNCTFYERGRGELSRRPTGTNCRMCGGTNPRKD